METQNQGREARRVYQAPVMALVQLRPEEAVLAACKTSSTTGNPTHGQVGCFQALDSCVTNGS